MRPRNADMIVRFLFFAFQALATDHQRFNRHLGTPGIQAGSFVFLRKAFAKHPARDLGPRVVQKDNHSVLRSVCPCKTARCQL